MFACSLVLALVVLGFVADRTLFLLRAMRTTGNVVDLNATNGRCRCGKRCHYDCTKFQALVSFQTRDAPATLWVSAGSATRYPSSSIRVTPPRRTATPCGMCGAYRS
jgi:hypothetical protein